MRHTRAAAPSRSRRLQMKELDAPVEVRRHSAAQRMTLRISRTRRAVIVTIPLNCDLANVGSFVSKNIDWVRARLGSIPEPVPFRDGALIPLRGEPHEIAFIGRQRQAGIVTLERAADRSPRLAVRGEPEHAPRRLKDWLFAEAHKDLAARVGWHAKNLGLAPKRIAVRDQASRWGSCSTTGVLSFSWRLVMAPSYILDYVAAHEVAHLIEMNHGQRFWNLVRKTMPRTDEAKRWLRLYGFDLHRYDPVR